MDLIYAQAACNTPMAKENMKSHHMTPLIIYIYVCIYTYKYTQYTRILCKNKLLFWMWLIDLTALVLKYFLYLVVVINNNYY